LAQVVLPLLQVVVIEVELEQIVFLVLSQAQVAAVVALV
jgi:hypothetical protein